ncbi:MAG: VWA domain-containing protein, partial [Gammaproteobacteria bacterium]
MARRRSFSVFSLSFLDVMSCGFGAVVLIFLVLNHTTQEAEKRVNVDRLAEVRLLDYQVQQGERDLFELLERVQAINARLDDADLKLASTRSALERRREDFSDMEEQTIAQRENEARLKSDLETTEREIERLRAMEDANDGGRIRSIKGEGDRQYLTGMKVGGKHVFIAVDSSASMLDETIVNVIRRRNMPEDRKRAAPKWQRAIRTAEWIAAQLPLDANFQLYAFNTSASALLPDRSGQWVPLGEGRELDAAMNALRATVPDGGSSLTRLISAIRDMNPPPDNVYLIVDSLPTQGDSAPRGTNADGSPRPELVGEAIHEGPAPVPVN